MYHEKYDYFLKLIIMGNPGVGKTSMFLRFTDDNFILSDITTENLIVKLKSCI